MNKKLIVIAIVIIFMPVAACKVSGKVELLGVNIPLEEMNDYIQIDAPPEINSLIMGENIQLILVNSSDTPVILPQDYGVHIYQYVDRKWESVDNWFDYPPGEKVVFPKKDQPFREIWLPVHPVVFSDQPVKVRIVVVGNLLKNNVRTEKQAGAYIDLILKPKNEKDAGPES